MNEPEFKINFSDPRTQHLVKLLRFSEHQPIDSAKKLFFLKTQIFVIALAREMERIEPLAFSHPTPEGHCAHLIRKRDKYKYSELENIRDACITMVESMLDKKCAIELKDAALRNFGEMTLGSWIKTSLKILAIGVITAAGGFIGFIAGAAISFGIAGIPGAILGLKTGFSAAITALTVTEYIGAGVGSAAGLMASSIGFFHKDERQVAAKQVVDVANKWLDLVNNP